MQTTTTATRPPAGVEVNGINVIGDRERKGRPRDLFWPWFGANVSVLGLGYGAFALANGVSFWQALIAGVIGIGLSFALCGVVSIAGRRGSAPTMVLSRATFGVNGNRLPAFISWVFTVGWETVLVILATLATATVFTRLGWGGGVAVKAIAMAVVAALTVAGGVLGFDFIMRLQRVITVIAGLLTVVYVILMLPKIHWAAVSAIPAGGFPAVTGTLILLMTGYGLGWVNAAADYSRYLPRRSSAAGIAGWTTLGGALAPAVLLIFGLLFVGSSDELKQGINNDPIGALANALPTWFLVPFILVAVLGLVGGAVLDIYSSGLALLTVGLKVARPVAALIDGVVMIGGSIYVVFGRSGSFFSQFQGFLITLGVPVAAWCGVFIGDLVLRRRDYDELDLYRARGRYGSVKPVPVGLLLLGTALGWGPVTQSVGWLQWLGYLLQPFGLGGRTGDWAYANLGVVVALLIGFVGTVTLNRRPVRVQEALPVAV